MLQYFYDNLSLMTLVNDRVQGLLNEELPATRAKDRNFQGTHRSHIEQQREIKNSTTAGIMDVFLNHLCNCRQTEESTKSFFKEKKAEIIGTSSNPESHI